MMVAGGHHSFSGTLSEESVLKLLSPAQLEQCLGASGEARQQMLYYFLANRLGNMSNPTNEPRKHTKGGSTGPDSIENITPFCLHI